MRRGALLLLGLPLLLLAGCGLDGPQTTVLPRSDLGRTIHDLFMNISGWALLIFVAVEALLIWVVVAFRDRPGRPEPRSVHGHLGLEIAWTLVPVAIVLSIAIPTVVAIFRTQAAVPAGALRVEVTGHRWWWEVRYPELGVVTANEVHLPVGRPVDLTLKSADVIHSFWVPPLGGKRDLIPGKVNNLTFTVEAPGEYPGQCAEFCGISHANMRLLVVARPPGEFEAWARREATGPRPPAGDAARGLEAFLAGGCAACHLIKGVTAGTVGPDLTHFGGRRTLASGILRNRPEDLAAWLRNPPALKPGALMPKLPLTDAQVSALVAYLRSLE